VDRRAAQHVDDALAHGLELARLVALHERGAGVLLDVDAAAGALAHQVGEDLAALAPGECGRYDGGHLVLGLVLLADGDGRKRERARAGGNALKEYASFHGSPSGSAHSNSQASAAARARAPE